MKRFLTVGRLLEPSETHFETTFRDIQDERQCEGEVAYFAASSNDRDLALRCVLPRAAFSDVTARFPFDPRLPASTPPPRRP